jgi:hypothetical protein
MKQCPSCGGDCGRTAKTGCRYGAGPTIPKPVEARYEKALSIAIYYQNRCCELEEIVEMFCADAEHTTKEQP